MQIAKWKHVSIIRVRETVCSEKMTHEWKWLNWVNYGTIYKNNSGPLHCVLLYTRLIGFSLFHLYRNLACLSFRVAHFSMTTLLKFGMSLVNFFSIDSMASAFNRSCDIVFLINVFIRLSVEKHLLDSAVVIGVVIRMRNSFTDSANTSCRLFLNSNNAPAPLHDLKSGVLIDKRQLRA